MMWRSLKISYDRLRIGASPPQHRTTRGIKAAMPDQ